MAELYLVSTPIGNRMDISLRALAVFKQLKYLLCEDTRKTKQLLDFYQISPLPKLVSFYEQNERMRIPEVLGWLKSGDSVGLVTNAGTPLLSDPGFCLVRECVSQGVKVTAVPGASALLSSLVISGLPMDKFMYLGFLPKKTGKKEKLLEKVKMMMEILPQTVVIYESPFRIIKTLGLLEKLMPERQIVIGRELTKKFEEVIRGSASELLEKLQGKKIKGEIVLMF